MVTINIKVLGVEPANKGAALMMAAVRQEVGARFPAARVGVDISTPFADRLHMGVWGVTPEDWETGSLFQRLKGRLSRATPRQREVLGLLDTSEINVVLDASGFAYGDFWGLEKFEKRLGRPMARWKDSGKTVIALPQAWGPFTEDGFSDQIRDHLIRADLVFARDSESLGFLEATGLSGIQLAPDFTNLLAPALPPKYAELEGGAFVIPNSKMIEARGEEARQAYLNFLVQAVQALRGVYSDTRILVHEGEKDRILARQLNERLDETLQIVDPEDPLHTKAILSRSGALVSSRFHGLVSALCAGVPSLACGWSHKYRELMENYGSEAHVIDMDVPESWAERLDAFLEDSADPVFRERLEVSAALEKDKARAAWDRIAAAIEIGTDASVSAALGNSV